MADKDKLELLKSITDFLKDKSTAFLLLIASSVFVGLSIVHKNYVELSFLTFIFAVIATYLTIFRKHETITVLSEERPKSYKVFIAVWSLLFNGWLLFWLVAILSTFKLQDLFQVSLSGKTAIYFSHILNYGALVLLSLFILLLAIFIWMLIGYGIMLRLILLLKKLVKRVRIFLK